MFQRLLVNEWCQLDSNQRHTDFQSDALPTELWHHLFLNRECKGSNSDYKCKCFATFFSFFFVTAKLLAYSMAFISISIKNHPTCLE